MDTIKYDDVSYRNGTPTRSSLSILSWESNAVEDRESIEYTESVYRLMKAYPESLTNAGTAVQYTLAARPGQSRNAPLSASEGSLMEIDKISIDDGVH